MKINVKPIPESPGDRLRRLADLVERLTASSSIEDCIEYIMLVNSIQRELDGAVMSTVCLIVNQRIGEEADIALQQKITGPYDPNKEPGGNA